MATGTRTSGLIQRVKSFVTHDRVEMDGGAQLTGADLDEAATDPNSPRTGATLYDGVTAAGVKSVDIP